MTHQEIKANISASKYHVPIESHENYAKESLLREQTFKQDIRKFAESYLGDLSDKQFEIFCNKSWVDRDFYSILNKAEELIGFINVFKEVNMHPEYLSG